MSPPMDRQTSSSRPTDSGRERHPGSGPALRLAGRLPATPTSPLGRCGPADLLGRQGGEGGDGLAYERTLDAPKGGEGAEDRVAGDHASAAPIRIDSFEAIAAGLEGETRRMFDEAVRLLSSLRSDREVVEAKLREAGREDPIRTVTGASALDHAIEETENLIRRLGGGGGGGGGGCGGG
jgi:hypothetical protein